MRLLIQSKDVLGIELEIPDFDEYVQSLLTVVHREGTSARSVIRRMNQRTLGEYSAFMNSNKEFRIRTWD